MTDPNLLPARDDDDPPVPAGAAPDPRISKLARSMGMSRRMLEAMPAEELDRMEAFVARSETYDQTWGDLAKSIVKKLTAAGFHEHNLYGPRGGFSVTVQEDGVLIGWTATEYVEDIITPFERTVMSAVIPALWQILDTTGFIGRVIPEDEDYGGDIRVTGWHGPSSGAAPEERLTSGV